MLLDTCVWGGAVAELAQRGHDVVWSGEWEKDPGDERILEIAHEERRVLVTLDKDFGELAIIHGHQHSGIIRLVRISATQQATYADAAIARFGEQLAAGAIVTVEPGRVRIRMAGSDD